MWNKPWKYKEGLVTGAGLIIAGVFLQLSVGRVNWDIFRQPFNYMALAAFIGLIVGAHALRKKVSLFAWLGSVPSAVCSIVLSSLLTVVMGLIRQRPSEMPSGVFPWTDQMLSNWSFVLVYVWMTFSLGLTILRVCIPFRASRIPFLLNHLGLFIALTCAVMGSADLQRLKMVAYPGIPERMAADSRGQVHELPLSINLKSFSVDERTGAVMSDVEINTLKGGHIRDTIQVNHPCRIEGWKIYQYGYDSYMGSLSEYSIFELVRDPWMPAVYVGILMLLAGAVLMFLKHI